MKKKILILGSKGMLGQDLVKAFRDDKKYEVIAWDREEIDITDEVQIQQKITELKPDIIINAAAYNAVDECEKPAIFKIAEKVNGLAVGYLAKIAKELNSLMVHYSSDHVFGGEKERGYKEENDPNPINKYGQSKLLGEQELQKNTTRYFLIRSSRLFGKPGSSQESKKSFFGTILNLARLRRQAKKRDKLRVINEEVSCFTYSADLAQATKDLIEKGLDFGIYHMVNSEPATWYEGVLELFKEAGIKVLVEPIPASKFPRPAKRPKFSILLNTKLPPMRSYKETLKEFLRYLPRRQAGKL